MKLFLQRPHLHVTVSWSQDAMPAAPVLRPLGGLEPRISATTRCEEYARPRWWFMGPKKQRIFFIVSCKIKWFPTKLSNHPHLHRILGGSLFWDTPAFHMLQNWCLIPIVLPNFNGPAFPVQPLQIVQACSWPLICWCCDILIKSSSPTGANCNPSPPWHKLRSNHL